MDSTCLHLTFWNGGLQSWGSMEKCLRTLPASLPQFSSLLFLSVSVMAHQKIEPETDVHACIRVCMLVCVYTQEVVGREMLGSGSWQAGDCGCSGCYNLQLKSLWRQNSFLPERDGGGGNQFFS